MALSSSRSSRFSGIFAFAGCVLLLSALGLAFSLAGEIYDYQDTVDGVHLPAVDAIICLAGGRGRIAAAGDFWYRYWEHSQNFSTGERPGVPILYISGMGPQSSWNVFARQLRRGVKDVIRPEDVIIEKESFNTEANARWVDLHARQMEWKRVLLITSPYHMRRARMIFERVLGSSPANLRQPVAIETLSAFQEPFDAQEWRSSTLGIRVTVEEYFKWLYYWYVWRP